METRRAYALRSESMDERVIQFRVGVVVIAAICITVILVGLFGVMAAGYLIMFLVYSLLLVGLSQFSLQVSRERSVGLGAMVPSASKVASSLIATLVVSLALLVTMLPGGGLYALGLSLSGDADAIGDGLRRDRIRAAIARELEHRGDDLAATLVRRKTPPAVFARWLHGRGIVMHQGIAVARAL